MSDADDADEKGRPRKAPTAFRTISEVADDLNIPQHVLRFWESKFPQLKPLKRGKVSEYLKHNVIVTNSGMAWEPAIKFAQQICGVDRVMYAMDYPYQYTPQEVIDLDNMMMDVATKKKFYQDVAEKVFKLV